MGDTTPIPGPSRGLLGSANLTVLQLNPTKTELIWFASELNVHRIATADVSVRVGDTVIQPCDRVRDLGVILDSSLSMRQHIAKVTSTCFFHLRRLRKIGHILDKNSRCRLVCAFNAVHPDEDRLLQRTLR